MSLLQDVLRTQTLDSLDRQLGLAADRDPRHSRSGRNTPQNDKDDSEDELVNVVRCSHKGRTEMSTIANHIL